MFDFLRDQSALILTGIIITFISSLIYRLTPTGFKSGGKYRTKQGAVIIYLAAAVILGFVTPLILELSKIVLVQFPLISIFGCLIVGANFIINHSIATWRHTTPKTLIIYAFGIVLILVGLYLR